MANCADAVSDRQFSQIMAATGPYEAAPHLAVAVSGGGDSLALALLAERWCRGRGGRVSALIVNHGLRPEATEEAACVGGWIGAHGIAHRTLVWDGPKPISGLQAAARAARYDLMSSWCRTHGVLHLLLGHTREDQAETFLMRLEKGSGPDGLAAMSRVRALPFCRLVRPLLELPRAALRTTLAAFGQAWIEDPSNNDRRFARVRIRNAIAAAGLAPSNLAKAASRYGEARVALQRQASCLVAASCDFHPAGFARFRPEVLLANDRDISLRALSRIVTAVGGAEFAPKRDRLERFHRKLTSVGAHSGTIGRCRFVGSGDSILICREERRLPEPVTAVPGEQLFWDDRFRVEFAPADGSQIQRYLACLGRPGWAEIVGREPQLRSISIPDPVRRTLPALFNRDGVLVVPHLGYFRCTAGLTVRTCVSGFGRLSFAPRNTLSGPGFFVA